MPEQGQEISLASSISISVDLCFAEPKRNWKQGKKRSLNVYEARNQQVQSLNLMLAVVGLRKGAKTVAGESNKNKASEEEIRRRAAQVCPMPRILFKNSCICPQTHSSQNPRPRSPHQAGEGEKDPYGTLGVDYDAQMTDIRKAYRK